MLYPLGIALIIAFGILLLLYLFSATIAWYFGRILQDTYKRGKRVKSFFQEGKGKTDD